MVGNNTEWACYRAGRALRVLQRPLRIVEPCVGIGGMRRLCELAEAPYAPVLACDIEGRFRTYYNALRKEGVQGLEQVLIGADADINSMSLSSVPDAECILAGPPCQPWAGTGLQAGVLDERCEAFETVVSRVIDQGWRGMLVCFAIENCAKLLKTKYLATLRRRFEVCLPFFRIEIQKHCLSELFPQIRQRVWIRGLRLDCVPPCPGLPPALTSADLGGKIVLSDLLDAGAAPLNPGKLGKGMQCNLAAYWSKIVSDVEAGKAGTVAVLQLDRNPLLEFSSKVFYDMLPPLRTGGPKLFLLLCEDVSSNLEWYRHSLHRFATIEERFRFQGHSDYDILRIGSKTQAMQATGNAFHPLHMASMVVPLLESALKHGGLPFAQGQRLCVEELRNMIPSEASPENESESDEGEDADDSSALVVLPQETGKDGQVGAISTRAWPAGITKRAESTEMLDWDSTYQPQRRRLRGKRTVPWY